MATLRGRLCAILVLGVAACAKPAGKGDAGTTTSMQVFPFDGVSIGLLWGDRQPADRLTIAPKLNIYPQMAAGSTPYWGAFCYEDNNYCAKPGTMTQVPEAVQGFRLNFADTSDAPVTITAASFTTAEMKFYPSTGQVTFEDRVTHNTVGTGCNPQATNAVGMTFTAGQERVIGGLYLYDQYANFDPATGYYNAYFTAGKVWHSTVVPLAPTSDSFFRFTFKPDAGPTTSAFGLNAFTDAASVRHDPAGYTGVWLSPKFGWGADDEIVDRVPKKTGSEQLYYGKDWADRPANWINHVLVGWCLQGTKGTRPLVLRSTTYSYRPQLCKLSLQGTCEDQSR